jgi:hypothetical protein
MADSSTELQGYVYILRNPAFPEFLKIGRTVLEPHVRARQLSAGTGIPAPYCVEWAVHVKDCALVERHAHAKLDAKRVRSNREFFLLPLNEAIAVVREIALPHQIAPPALPVTAVREGQRTKGGAPAKTAKANPSAESKELKQVTYYSAETHSAEQMAPNEKTGKLEMLARLRELVLKVSPDALWRMRDDGKITFTPMLHKDRLTGRNLMTVHLRDNPINFRVGTVVQRFTDADFADVECRMRSLLAKRDGTLA